MFELKLEDLLFLECTPRFPAAQRLEAAFGKEAKVLAVHDGPELHGWPTRRRRVLACVVNLRTCAWMGASEPSRVSQDYAERFARKIVSTGAVFLQAGDEERAEEWTKMALIQKNKLAVDDVLALMRSEQHSELMRLAWPPGAIKRWEEWKTYYETWCEKKEPFVNNEGRSIPLPENPDKIFLCDVDHNCEGKGPSSGPLFPCQLTHGTIVCFSKDSAGETRWRLVTTSEHYIALGWHMSTKEGCYAETALKRHLQQFTSQQAKAFSGNSMHLLTQSAWMLYCLFEVMMHQPQSQKVGPQRASSWEIGSWDL